MIQEFTQQIKNTIRDCINGIHTAIPGKIIFFDPEKCEAAVLPYGKYTTPSGIVIDYPTLNGVPVLIPQYAAQTATIAFPIKPGDECLLLFCEQPLDGWRSGTKSTASLRFDLSSAVTLVGLFAKPNPLVKTACDEDALILEKGGSRITIRPKSIIEITGNVVVYGDLDVKGNISNSGNMATLGIHSDANGTHKNQNSNQTLSFTED
jgi:hypothetical protein